MSAPLPKELTELLDQTIDLVRRVEKLEKNLKPSPAFIPLIYSGDVKYIEMGPGLCEMKLAARKKAEREAAAKENTDG